MTPDGIVEPVDLAANGLVGFLTSAKDGPPDGLGFQGLEERLHHGVVIAISLAGHRDPGCRACVARPDSRSKLYREAVGLVYRCIRPESRSEEALVHVPSHLSFEEGATLPCAAVTAWVALTVPSTGHGGRHRPNLGFRWRFGLRALTTLTTAGEALHARVCAGWKKLRLEQSLGTRLVTYADNLVILCLSVRI